MGLINSRKIVRKALIENKKIKFILLLGDAIFDTEYFIPKITKNKFESLNQIQRYLKRKGLLIFPWFEEGEVIYNTNELKIEFEVETDFNFNVSVLICNVLNSYYIYEIKESNNKEHIIKFSYLI